MLTAILKHPVRQCGGFLSESPGSCHEVSGADVPSRDFVAQQNLS